MIFNSARTIYNIKIQTCKLLDLEYTPLVNTTINEVLSIYPNYVMSDPIMPKLNVMVFGIGGIDIINNTSLNLKRAKHGSIDGTLFEMIPLMIKTSGYTLSDIERNTYRLKKSEIIDGTTYDVYYGMVLNHIEYDPNIYKINSTELSLNSNIINTATDTTILNPIPKVGDLDITSDYNYVINTCKIGVNLDATVMNELTNALSIKYPNDNINSITEIGMCTSVDMDIDNYLESIWTQVNYYIDLSMDIQLLNSKIAIDNNVFLNVDIGGMEPLII